MLLRGRNFARLFVWICSAISYSSALANPPSTTHYILDPETQNHPLTVYSYSNNNVIQAGSTTLNLDQDEFGTIPAGSDLAPGIKVEGLGPFALGSGGQTVDAPSPAAFLGTQFVIPHIRNAHKVYLNSPSSDAEVTVDIGGAENSLSLTRGNVFEYSLGSDNTISTIIESDVPILITHVAENSSSRLDAFPAPPTAKELWGVRSKNVLIGASIDNTNVTVFTSNGNTQNFLLNRGDRELVTVGSNASEGAGSGIHIVADQPISAVQYADSDGSEATSFLPKHYLSTHIGIPVGAQYIAVTCPYGNTSVTLYDGANSPDTQFCNGSPSNFPGKAFFGSTTDGLSISQGAYIRSSKPVFSYFEVAAGSEEKQLLGNKEGYIVLSPWTEESVLSIVSLEDNNTIEAGSTSLILNKGELGVVPAGGDLAPGREIRGSGAFDVSSMGDGVAMPASGMFLGLQFAIPHLRGFHVYDLYSPVGNATVEITIGGSSQTVDLIEGQVLSYDVGNDNLMTGVLKSSHPIYVYHRATSAQGAGTRYDAYPVPPADTEFWGVRSNSLFIAAIDDGTTATAFSDNGGTQVFTLQAGQLAEVTIGSSVSQGGGSAIYVLADKPINAIAYDDGDGLETISAWSSAFRGVYYGIPIDAQYVSIICPHSTTEVTLRDGVNPPQIQNCDGTGQFPGKAFFGSDQNGVHVYAGASISSNKPIFVHYESSTTDDERNLLGTLNGQPNPVSAQFSTTPESGNAPLDVFFDGSASSSVNAIMSYLWDFGDGSIDTGALVSHRYAQAGTYLVSLIVEDDEGATDQATVQVMVGPPAPAQVLFHSGLISSVTDSWQTIILPDTFSSMVVVTTVVLPDQSSVPAVARIRNASGNQFDIKLQNPSGSPISGYSVHFVVAEEGQYNETEHGINMEVVKLNSTITASKGSWLRQVGGFYNTYSNPVVIGQVMSESDPNWSVFWASSNASQTSIPSGANLAAGKHVAEDTTSSRNDELLGYIVLEAGAYNIDGVDLLAGVGDDVVRGVGNSATGYTYPISNVSNPETAILSSAAMDGGDGGWPVLFGVNPVSANAIQLIVDEDQISDSERSHTTEQVAYLVISGQSNVTPTASFTVEPSSGGAPLIVNVDASGSSDGDGTITNYEWDFGDGNTGSGVAASHQYTASGNYTLTLTVTDDGGATDPTTLPINVITPNQAPTAFFTANPISGDTPLTVNVDATGSNDSDGTILSYTWDYGDGNAGTGSIASNEYTAAGSYTITLTVSDDDGAIHQTTLPISITPPNRLPTANFTAIPTTGDLPLTVNVDASGSSDPDGTIVEYTWDFGDGFTGQGVAANHEYLSEGTFALTLTVTDNDGETAQVSTDILVNGFEPPDSIPPLISTPSGTSLINPVVIEGTASPNADIRLYSNGQSVGNAISNSNGMFNFDVPLNHGQNAIYAVSVIDGGETDPSNVISVSYTNTLAPEQGGVAISDTVIWPELPDGQFYTIHNGDITITETGKLIVLPGVKVVASHEKLIVKGKLIANGTPEKNIEFTESGAIYAFGGIYIEDTATEVEITHAVIEHANYGVHLDYAGAQETFLFENNILRENLWAGVYISGSSEVQINSNAFTGNRTGIVVAEGGSSTTIQENLFDLNDTGIAIVGGGTSPVIHSNTITRNDDGIRIIGKHRSEPNEPYGNPEGLSLPILSHNAISENEIGISLRYRSNPRVLNNQITDNEVGIYLNGHSSESSVGSFIPDQDIEPPLPTINNNSFADNNRSGSRRQNIVAYNFYRGASLTIDATNNWWGASNPADIADQLEHEGPDSVYEPFIDYSSFLDSPLPQGITVEGNFIFRIQEDLTLVEDEEYIFVEKHIAVEPDNFLTIEAGVKMIFAVPTPGYAGSSVDRRLEVKGAMTALGTPEKPIQITSASTALGSWSGIDMDGGLLQIDHAEIENATVAVDARYSGSEITISNSEFSNNYKGIRLFTDNVTGNVSSSFFAGNTIGIEIGVNGTISTIRINDNEIHGNTERGMLVQRHASPSGNTIDATRNWWGNAPPIIGTDIYWSSPELEPWIDFSNYAFAPLNAVFPEEFLVEYSDLSPDGNGVQDSTSIQGCFPETLEWVVFIENSTGVMVRSWSGQSQCFDFSWDGSDDIGNYLPDGDFNLKFYEPQNGLENAIELGVLSLNTIAPVVVPPKNILSNANAELTNINIGTALATDWSGNTIAVTPDNTGPFALGATAVTWTAMDSYGNSASATQIITINDNIRPSLTVPGDLFVFSDVPVEVELGEAAADDLFLESLTNNAPAIFPVGTTVVTWAATDTSGNLTQVDQIVEVSDIEVVATTPLSGSITNQNMVIVQGTLKAPDNTGLTVNGEVAYIDRTVFPFEFSLSVALEDGANDIDIKAQSLSGLTAVANLLVTRQGAVTQTPYSVTGSNTLGIGPLEVKFDISGLETGLVASIIYDWDGDGVDDFTYDVPQNPLPEKVIQPYVYDTPGSFQAEVTVKEFSGVEYEYLILVQVLDPIVLDSMLQSIWSNFNQALLAGDKAGAENLMADVMKHKYSDVIGVLMPQFPAIIASYTQFRPINLKTSYAGYVLNRTINGVDRVFFVYFLKGKDGVWRLVSM